MNKIINILNQDGQLVVTSRQTAEDFEKEHAKINRDIENLIGGISKNGDTYNHLFIETQYQNEQNKQWYKEYLLTRDGFSLLVMGFTGSKALSWKLKYIEAFNKMEEALKVQALNTSELSPELQMFNKMFQALANNELEQKKLKSDIEETKEEIKGIREAVTLNPNAWRRDTSILINKIASKLGGFEHIEPIRKEAYALLNSSYG
ncbi:phage antirepressor Ant, partial [Clostridium perfringens]|uniref:Rha family transcriptional regulator n=1 Tax=Clostridium perfringens TaxID=1502 RepID=UPI002AC3C91E